MEDARKVCGLMISARRFVILHAVILLLAGCSGDIAWLDIRDQNVPPAKRTRACIDSGDVDGAVRLLTEAVNAHPELARAHFDLAVLLHEHSRNYVGAIYHYRRYLDLRPKTEKREMIEGRIRVAGKLFAAGIIGSDRAGAGEGALQKENARLRERVRALRKRLDAPGVTAAPSGGAEAAAMDGGARSYKVQEGDTLASIAGAMYNDREQWKRIYTANEDVLLGPDSLTVGQVLAIP